MQYAGLNVFFTGAAHPCDTTHSLWRSVSPAPGTDMPFWKGFTQELLLEDGDGPVNLDTIDHA